MPRAVVKWLGVAVAAAACVAAVGAASASCASTPTAIPVRTLQQSQKVDTVCMTVNDANGNSLPVSPTVQAECAPVPVGVTGSTLPNHLYAVVTQTTRGELAVVDLTGGDVVDIDRSTPGIQFITVGEEPTDVAVGPDGQFTFVSCAEVNKPAIYVIPNDRLLGDSAGPPADSGTDASTGTPLHLTDLSVCALPQPPDALAVEQVPGVDGGPPSGKYVIVAMLRAAHGQSAKIVTIDPNGIVSNAPLSPCPVVGAIELASDVPSSWTIGPAWPDGVPYADAGDLRATEPRVGPTCAGVAPDGGLIEGGTGGVTGGTFMEAGAPLDPPRPVAMALRDDVPVLYVSDASLPIIHVIDLTTPTTPRELPPLLATSLLEPARRVTVGQLAVSPPTRDYKRYLYGVDSSDKTLIVYDVTDAATSPRTPLVKPHPELSPLLPPDRIAFTSEVATVAFVQHDWPLASMTDPMPPNHAATGLLCNPNPNAFTATSDAGVVVNDLGYYYRADQVTTINSSATVELMPYRLRGVFGFVTLSNGLIIPIDVDDWDAPCRRPDPMTANNIADPDPSFANTTYPGGLTGTLDIAEPAPSATSDVDPYHAPITYTNGINESAAVTLEEFFPTIAPHRARSLNLLRNDPTNGLHIPNVLGTPQLFDVNGSPVAVSGTAAQNHPLLLPTPLTPGFIDPTYETSPAEPNPGGRVPNSMLQSYFDPTKLQMGTPNPLVPPAGTPGVRVSFEDPTAQVDQDWTVTYEGALPTIPVNAVSVAIDGTSSNYQTLTLSSPGAKLCSAGIEDAQIGKQRVAQVLAELTRLGLPQPVDLDKWTGDYVEFNDDILAQGDEWYGYGVPNGAPPKGIDCWDPAFDTPDKRFNACQQAFDLQSDADTHLARDFPILQAFDDRLVVGRFGWPALDNSKPPMPVPEATTNRVIVGADPGNAGFLRLATCCFHQDVTIKVRTGGEWVAAGSVVGLLHHVVADPVTNACVLSCDPRASLLESRAFDVPWGTFDPMPMKSCQPPAPIFDRNSPIALRNPMFSFVAWSGCGQLPGFADHTLTQRDYQWKFTMRGGYQPLTVSLTGQTTTAVSPQSMRFIPSLGQLAIVDGETQGLVLIDLNTIAFAQNPFF
jgi:hypothetical protein